MMAEKTSIPTVRTHLSLGFLAWLGGAIHVMNQPGGDFWDGLIWLYYVGRYIAIHFTALTG